MRYKKLVPHVESQACAVSLLESREQRYIKAIIINIWQQYNVYSCVGVLRQYLISKDNTDRICWPQDTQPDHQDTKNFPWYHNLFFSYVLNSVPHVVISVYAWDMCMVCVYVCVCVCVWMTADTCMCVCGGGGGAQIESNFYIYIIIYYVNTTFSYMGHWTAQLHYQLTFTFTFPNSKICHTNSFAQVYTHLHAATAQLHYRLTFTFTFPNAIQTVLNKFINAHLHAAAWGFWKRVICCKRQEPRQVTSDLPSFLTVSYS